ncbi:phosphoribosylamine--glycine ligase [Peptoniphilus equinus]|uniref:Phosphoribosylamine--glycine ligase n=1 Tax=Peptoniphilus equinus TaxID=3016343 RepID=A0ABY7QV22_9FIRM|nr:phosphoribosylamine--glycine ligase [Peptoniphilus equinus]WBW50033.1 phosphoribosylamine--glycine ligase [Peptoniphilus equinus]
MKVLVIGGGGREYSLMKKLHEEGHEVYGAKGNGGTAAFATNVAIDPDDVKGLLDFAETEGMDLTIVGPENPLCSGIVDAFEAKGLRIFGPRKKEAQFEGSKDFTKAFLEKHRIPTAAYATYFDYDSAVAGLDGFSYPLVVKADGLCLGKGVTIAHTKDEATAALRAIFVDNTMNSDRVVLETFLDGREISVVCMASHNRLFAFESTRDYKKIGDGDTGPNTGGVGNIIPLDDLNAELKADIDAILRRIEAGLDADGFDYTGILFVGFMITDKPYVLEFNVRFGDPETEVIMEKLTSNISELMEKAIEGTLTAADFTYDDKYYTGVMLCSGGYPGSYEKGFEITGLDDVDNVIHCGTKAEGDHILTNGGRVLMVIGEGKTKDEATQAAYRDVAKIHFEHMTYRKDIGQ